MRLVHFADTHLGFRQFDRVTPIGVNRREADVEETFHRLIDKVVEIAPDLIIVAGDNFHVPRPSNHAIVNAIQEYQRLVRSLPSTRIVLVAGNHDSPKSTDTGGILGSLAPLGIHIVDQIPERIDWPDWNMSVTAVPESPAAERAIAEARAAGVRLGDMGNAASKYNVMVLHGEVHGMPGHHDRSREVQTDDLRAPEWNYIGLGHYHVHHNLAPNMAYSGSIDYTSTDPWGEMVDEDKRGIAGKGFVERDLDTGAQTFHALTTSRPYLELPTFDARDMTSLELDAAIRAAVESTSIDGKAVRLVVTGVVRDLGRAIDQKAIKEFHLRALNFHLDMRRPDVTRIRVSGVDRQSKRLEDRMHAFFADFQTAPDVSKPDLVALAEKYLAEARGDDLNSTTLADSLNASLAEPDTERQLDLSSAA